MRKIRGTIVYFCIPILAISWLGGTYAAPPPTIPLLKKYFASDLTDQQIPTATSSSNCNYYTDDGTAIQRQQLLNQARILLNQLSSCTPSSNSLNIPRIISTSTYGMPSQYALENMETVLLQDLVNRLEILKQNSVAVAEPSPSRPVISEATYNAILNQYLDVRLLTLDLLNSRDAELIQATLDDLFKTFVKIITRKLANAEMPNLCSKTLALNSQLKTTDASEDMRNAVVNFLESLTVALTGQSQVTVLAICDSLNDLETSVVTVVQNYKSQQLQYLLSNLVDAVINAVISGGDVGCNVIDVVRRYVASIREAIKQEENVRAGKIYNSVLTFEEELYKVLTESNPTATQITSSTPKSKLPDSKIDDEYLSEIGQLSKAIFGDRTNLVKSAVEILLDIKESQNPSTADQPTSTENFEKVYNLLKSVNTYPQVDSTRVLERLVDVLSTLSEEDSTKVLNALDSASDDNSDTYDPSSDATIVAVDGEIFIVKEEVVTQNDDSGTIIDRVKNGTYKFVDPYTYSSWTGSFEVENGTVEGDSEGNYHVVNSGVYIVDPVADNSSSTAPTSNLQAIFTIEDDIVQGVDNNGNSKVIEGGKFTLTDPDVGTSKSGDFIVENTISKSKTDGSKVVIKTGLLYVDKPADGSSGEKPSSQDGIGYFLFDDTFFASPDSEGNVGSGIYNIKNPKTNAYESGTYEIRESSTVKDTDGSILTTTSGVIYVDGIDPTSTYDNADPVLIVMNGANFTFVDRGTTFTDPYGHETVVCVGEFTQTDPETGTTKNGTYVVQNFITTENPDGSTEVTKFGRFSSNTISTPTDDTSTTGSTADTQNPADSTSEVAKQPDKGKSSSTNNPDKDADADSSSEMVNNESGSNPLPLVSDHTYFIIDEFITPSLNDKGEVVETLKMGTYYFTDSQTNIPWGGAFEVEDSTTRTISTDQKEVTESGTFEVNPTESSENMANFNITNYISNSIDERGFLTATEKGIYLLTDPTTGDTKTGKFVVENSIVKSQSDGTIEIIKSGLLVVDKPNAPSPDELEPLDKMGYVLCNYYFNTLNDDGTASTGSGTYSLKNPNTDEHLTGTYAIDQASVIKNSDGSIDLNTEGIISLDDTDADTTSDRPNSAFIVKNGARLVLSEHLDHSTDINGYTTGVGTGKYTLTDPETGVTFSKSYNLKNVVITTDDDGGVDVMKFGVIPTHDRSVVQPSTSTKGSTSDNQDAPLPITADSFETLLNSLNPTKTTTGSTKSTSSSNTNGDQDQNSNGSTNESPLSSTGYPTYDAALIPTSGASFIIDEHLVTQRNSAGDVIGLQKTGRYSLMDPQTNVSWSGNFKVDDLKVQSAYKGETNLTESGTLDVSDSTNSSSSSPNQANFLIEDHVNSTFDGNKVSALTEDGIYYLTNPETGKSTAGSFVVTNSVVKDNSDGTIDVIKSGILYVNNDSSLTLPSEQPLLVDSPGYFLFNDNIFATLDSEGNMGNGVYNVKDPKTNEFTSGSYVIQEASTIANPDGTVDLKTSGIIYVDEFQSSPSASSDPTVSIINGAYYTFDDHLSYVTDAYGHINVVGTGVFTQTDPQTNLTKPGTYVIHDVNTKNNTDGSQDIIKYGIFEYTSDTNSSGDSSTTSTVSDNSDSTQQMLQTSSPTTLTDLQTSLEALLNSLKAMQTETQPQTQIIQTSPITSTTYSNPGITSNYVIIPRCDVLSAINGQSLMPGEIVAVRTTNGGVFAAKIQDLCSPVTFYATNWADLTRELTPTTRVWNVQAEDFSKKDRNLFDAVITSGNPAPCNG